MTWPTKKLGEVAQYINGRAFKPSEWTDSGLPIIRIQNLTGMQEKFNYFNGKLEERYIVEKGDILLSWSASLGVYVWDKERAALNQHIFKVIPYSIINKRYLLYTLVAVIERLKKQVHGSTMTHITKPTFERNKILLPPPDIQHQIAERLDAIRKAQELNDKQIALADEFFQSLSYKELNSKIKDWKDINFGEKEIMEIIDGDRGKNYPKKNEFKKSGYCVFLNTKNVTANGFVFNEIDFISKERDEKLRKGRLQRNDVVLTTRGTVGNSALYGESVEFNNIRINSGMVIIRSNTQKIIPKFLLNLIQNNLVQDKFKQILSGSAQPQLPICNLVKIKFPLPPLGIQRQIAGKLQVVKDYKKKLSEQKQKLQELFSSCLNKEMKGG